VAKIKFHPDLKKEQKNAETAEELEGFLGFSRKERRPGSGPDQAEGGRAEEEAGEDFADGESLANAASEQPEKASGGNDEDPLQQDESDVVFNRRRVHGLVGKLQVRNSEVKNYKSRDDEAGSFSFLGGFS
jgi:hypothetical protein